MQAKLEAQPVLMVRDVEASIQFYERLGFGPSFEIRRANPGDGDHPANDELDNLTPRLRGEELLPGALALLASLGGTALPVTNNARLAQMPACGPFSRE